MNAVPSLLYYLIVLIFLFGSLCIVCFSLFLQALEISDLDVLNFGHFQNWPFWSGFRPRISNMQYFMYGNIFKVINHVRVYFQSHCLWYYHVQVLTLDIICMTRNLTEKVHRVIIYDLYYSFTSVMDHRPVSIFQYIPPSGS